MEDIFNKLANICRPQNITIGSDFVAFDFEVKRESIYTGNLSPEQINKINSCDRFEARSQFLYGYIGRKLIFECHVSFWNEQEVKEHYQYFKDKTRNKPHYEINKDSL